MAFNKSLFSMLVAVMVAFASANEFHHPDVADLKGSEFTEKVWGRVKARGFPLASHAVSAGVSIHLERISVPTDDGLICRLPMVVSGSSNSTLRGVVSFRSQARPT